METWTIDGKNTPNSEARTEIPFSYLDTCMNQCSLPNSQSFHSMPLTPRVGLISPPDGVFFCVDESTIRIGTKLYRKRSQRDGKISFIELNNNTFGKGWEELCARGPFLIGCCRRKYRRQLLVGQKKDGQQIKDCQNEASIAETGSFSRFSNLLPRGPFRRKNTDLPTPSSFILDSRTPNGTKSERSWKFVAGSSSLTGFEDPSNAPSTEEPHGEAGDSPGDGITSYGSSYFGCAYDIERLGLKSQASDPNDVAYDTTSTDGETSSEISEEEMFQADPSMANPEPSHGVMIEVDKYSVTCDSCNESTPRQFYHCVKCCNDNFDICNECYRRGVWCSDLNHELYRVIDRNPVGVVFQRNFKVKQELIVYRMDAPNSQEAIFHFRKSYSAILHKSPPVIHPKLSLVVWALSGSSLLFADFEKDEYFEQKIDVKDLKKTRPICVSLSFSPNGSILRVAILDSVTERQKSPPAEDNTLGDQPRWRICLNVRVLLLRLSSKNPTSSPPKLLATKVHRLGCSYARPFVPTLPFAFTWGANEVYLTLSDWYLNVRRIILPEVEQEQTQTQKSRPLEDRGNQFSVLALGETILLPRSARNRSVQFFPAKEADDSATVIIGPRYGRYPKPPIGVYLTGKDLGRWVPAKEEEREGNSSRVSMKRQLGLPEEPFDENDDCDLIPFDGY
ncbi:hypothetical protein V8C37DRAFT_30231 [Trichoderma ceciliae]